MAPAGRERAGTHGGALPAAHLVTQHAQPGPRCPRPLEFARRVVARSVIHIEDFERRKRRAGALDLVEERHDVRCLVANRDDDAEARWSGKLVHGRGGATA